MFWVSPVLTRSRKNEIPMPLTQSELIEVRQTRGKGRGVFARMPIAEGAVIERAPVIVCPTEEIVDTVLGDYVFTWGRDSVAITLGYGSIYNHSYRPNAKYEDRGRQTKVFIACRDIEAGEEITINYNGDPADPAPVGFEVVDSQ